MDKYRYKMVLDKQRIERKQIWADGSLFGKREVCSDILSFMEWFDFERNPDLHEMRFYIENRMKSSSNDDSHNEDVNH